MRTRTHHDLPDVGSMMVDSNDDSSEVVDDDELLLSLLLGELLAPAVPQEHKKLHAHIPQVVDRQLADSMFDTLDTIYR